MIKPRAVYFTILLFFIPLLVQAQVNDAGLWLSAGLEKKITQRLSACFTGEVRMNENITEAGTLLGDIGIKYKFGKRFSADAMFRYTLKKRLDDTYERRFGWYIDGTYREKISFLILNLRTRFQSKYTEFYTSEKTGAPKNHIREKLTLKFDLRKKFEPYAYAEVFFRLNDPENVSFDEFRICGGIEYNFNRMHQIDLKYLICSEINVENPETDYVIGLSYCFTF
ncbi:MAG: DUF2490 domain-containing protein [Bacteroidales bacterium]|nr:DUF2490 domain-containing protein [Bacteroidales bacterium]